MKNAHTPTKKLFLYALDELRPDEKALVAAHIENCESCARLIEAQQAVIRRMESYPRLLPAESLLWAARQRLRNALLGEARRREDRLIEFGARRSRPSPVLRLATAGAFLMLGIVIGRFSFSGMGATVSPVVALSSAPTVTNFRIEPSIEKDHHVEIRFRAVQDFTLRGNVNNPDIQFALAYALVNDRRDNIRLQTVDLLETSGYTESVQGALLHAVERDENPGVRLKAVRLLKNLPLNESIKQILISALFQDPISGIQREAADALTRFEDPDVLAVLQKKAEDDEYMKFLIQRLSQETSIPTTNKNM